MSADQVHSWIGRHIPPGGPRPRIVRPINYVRIVAVTTTLMGLITAFSVASPYILPLIQNRNLWAAISLICVLLFTSGHMFNHIRKVPYVSGDGKGGITYFAGGFSNQFGMETQIIAAMCEYCASLSGWIVANRHSRWRPCLRYDSTGLEGPKNGGCQGSTGCGVHVGCNIAWDVQLPAQYIQG